MSHLHLVHRYTNIIHLEATFVRPRNNSSNKHNSNPTTLFRAAKLLDVDGDNNEN